MRKATLFLMVAAITLWTGTVAWSMPQEKKQDANAKNSGHATEKADTTDQASDDAQQGDDAGSKDATVKRKKQPRDKENDSSVKPSGDEGIGSQASENAGSNKEKKKTPEIPPGRPANNGEELSVQPGGNEGIGSQASENAGSNKSTSGAPPSNSTTCCADLNGDGQTDKAVKKPVGGTHDRESSMPSVSEGVIQNPNAGSGGGGGTGAAKEKIVIHHEGMLTDSTGDSAGRESPTKATLGATSTKPAKDVKAAPGGEENPKETVEYKDGEDGTTRIRKKPDMVIPDPPNSTTDRESPSKPTLGRPPTKPSQDVQPESGGAQPTDSAVTFGRDKLKSTTKTQGDYNLSNRASGGGEELPKESVTATSPASKNKGNMSDAQNNPMYKENKSEGTNPLYEGKDKVAQPPSSTGGGSSDAQKMKNAGDYNLSHKFSVEISGKQQQGTSGTGTPNPKGGSGEGTITSRKAGKDQNTVAGSGEENPKETVTTIDAHTKRVTPSSDTSVASGHDNESPKETVTGTSGRVEEKHRPPLVKRSDASANGDEAPKETVSGSTTEIKNSSYYCGKTNHFRECKPGETPTVTNPAGGTSSSDDTAKKKTKPQNPPPNISDGAAKGQASEGVAPDPNAGGSGNTPGGTPASPK